MVSDSESDSVPEPEPGPESAAGPGVMRAALVLVATPIGNLGDLSPRAVEELRTATFVAAEDTRRTRGLFTHAGIPGGRRLRSVHQHNEREGAQWITRAVAEGARVAYVTDAGMPGVSDPGAHLVRACLDAGLPVEVVGLNGAHRAGFGVPDRPVSSRFPSVEARAGAVRVARGEARPCALQAPSHQRHPARPARCVDRCGSGGGRSSPSCTRRCGGTLAALSRADAEARGEHVIARFAPTPPEA
jgi:16S rRNA (cytidine1402-2'-O)-methyltransferase